MSPWLVEFAAGLVAVVLDAVVLDAVKLNSVVSVVGTVLIWVIAV